MVKQRILLTIDLIDEIVYRLYGLAEDEIEMVEEAQERRLVKRTSSSVSMRLKNCGILNSYSSCSIPPGCHLASCSRLSVHSSNYRIDSWMWEVFFLSRYVQPCAVLLLMRVGGLRVEEFYGFRLLLISVSLGYRFWALIRSIHVLILVPICL